MPPTQHAQDLDLLDGLHSLTSLLPSSCSHLALLFIHFDLLEHALHTSGLILSEVSRAIRPHANTLQYRVLVHPNDAYKRDDDAMAAAKRAVEALMVGGE